MNSEFKEIEDRVKALEEKIDNIDYDSLGYLEYDDIVDDKEKTEFLKKKVETLEERIETIEEKLYWIPE